MADLGTLKVYLFGDTTQFNRSMNKASQTANRMAKSIVRTSKIAAAGMAALAVKSVFAAAKQEKAERQLAATLRATGFAAGFSSDELKKYAAQLQQSTNIADDEILKSISVMTTFRNVTGETFKESISLATDMSAVLGTSLNSSVIQLGKALNDPIRGVTALTRVGITFTDQQKEQIKTLQESGDLLGAQEIILQELRMQFKGAAEEMAKAEPWKQLTNAIGDALEGIGFIIKETFSLNENFDTMGKTIQRWAGMFRDRAIEVGNTLKIVFIEVVFGLKKAVAFMKTWGEMVINTFRLMGRYIKAVVVFMVDNFIAGFRLLVDAAAATGRAIWEKMKHPTRKFKIEVADIRTQFKALKVDTSGLVVDTQRVARVEAERVETLKGMDLLMKEQAENRAKAAHDEQVIVKAAKKALKVEEKVTEEKKKQNKIKRAFAAALERGTAAAFSATLLSGGGMEQQLLNENEKQTGLLGGLVAIAGQQLNKMAITTTVNAAAKGAAAR